MSLQDKIKTFSNSAQNEEEMREKQRKKAAFTEKMTKFANGQDPGKKDSEALKKAQMFSEWEGKDEREKEARAKKDQFLKTAGKFKGVEETNDTKNKTNTEVTKKLSMFEEQVKEEVIENDEESERKRQEFADKQKMFQ